MIAFDDDKTPVSTPPEVQQHIRKMKSSQEAVRNADMCALELLRCAGVSREEEDRLLDFYPDIIARYFDEHGQKCVKKKESEINRLKLAVLKVLRSEEPVSYLREFLW